MCFHRNDTNNLGKYNKAAIQDTKEIICKDLSNKYIFNHTILKDHNLYNNSI